LRLAGAYQWGKVDLVLSGLNIGLNLGNSIWHSGTVAAARQAALLGIRGIALSAPAGAEPDFEPYKPWVRRVLDTLLEERSLSLVNVNLPREPRGLVWTRASVRRYDGESCRRRIRRDVSCIGSGSPPLKALMKAPIDGRWNAAGFH
jgi:5'-nucleotidase